MDSEEIKSSIREKYDQEVAAYDGIFINKSGRHFIKKKLGFAKGFGKIKEGQHLLEIGSATGIFSFEFEKLGINLTSIDLSPQNIRWAENKANRLGSEVKFICADAENLPFEDNKFDGILSFSTLRYVPDLEKALLEIHRVLVPGGYMIIDFPNKRCPWFGGLKKKVLGREHIFDNHYYREDIHKLLAKTGFRNIELKGGLFIPKSTPDGWFWLFQIFEMISENIPFLNRYSAILFVKGEK